MLFRGKSRLVSVAVAVVALLLLTIGTALAQEAENALKGDPKNDPKSEVRGEAAEAELLTVWSGGTATGAVVASETNPTTIFCCGEVIVASATIGVAADGDLLVAEFSAETACAGAGFNQCFVRARAVNALTGAVFGLDPNVFDLVYDSEDPSSVWAESHSHQFARRLAGGTYRVQILARTNAGGAFFLDERTLSVTRFS